MNLSSYLHVPLTKDAVLSVYVDVSMPLERGSFRQTSLLR